MRAEDIFKDKPYLDRFDIMNIYGCGVCKAYAIIRSIHYVSNVLGMQSRVSEQDYIIWFNNTKTKCENK